MQLCTVSSGGLFLTSVIRALILTLYGIIRIRSELPLAADSLPHLPLRSGTSHVCTSRHSLANCACLRAVRAVGQARLATRTLLIKRGWRAYPALPDCRWRHVPPKSLSKLCPGTCAVRKCHAADGSCSSVDFATEAPRFLVPPVAVPVAGGRNGQRTRRSFVLEWRKGLDMWLVATCASPPRPPSSVYIETNTEGSQNTPFSN